MSASTNNESINAASNSLSLIDFDFVVTGNFASAFAPVAGAGAGAEILAVPVTVPVTIEVTAAALMEDKIACCVLFFSLILDVPVSLTDPVWFVLHHR